MINVHKWIKYEHVYARESQNEYFEFKRFKKPAKARKLNGRGGGGGHPLSSQPYQHNQWSTQENQSAYTVW